MPELSELTVKELSQRHGELVTQLQAFVKENPETKEKRWSGEQNGKFDRINKDLADVKKEIDVRENDAAFEKHEAEKKALVEEHSKYAFGGGTGVPLYEGRQVIKTGQKLDAETLQRHQSSVFFEILADEQGVKNAELIARRYIEENGLSNILPTVEFSMEKSRMLSKDFFVGDEIAIRNDEGRVVERRKVEKHALVVRDTGLGGAAVPPQQYADTIRSLGAPTMLMGRVRRMVATGPYLPFLEIKPHPSDVRYPTGMTDRMVAEADVTTISSASTQDVPQTGTQRIEIHKWKPKPQFVSSDLVADAPTFEAECKRAIDELFRLGVESRLVNGTGQDEALGILMGSGTEAPTSVNSGASGAFTWEGLMDLIFSGVPPQYAEGSVAVMTRASHGYLYKIQDNGGRFVLGANTPVNQLMGYEVVHSEFVPAVGAGAKAIIFGNLNYYIWADRQELMIGRVDQLAWPDIYLQPVARFGGKLTIGKAVAVQVLS